MQVLPLVRGAVGIKSKGRARNATDISQHDVRGRPAEAGHLDLVAVNEARGILRGGSNRGRGSRLARHGASAHASSIYDTRTADRIPSGTCIAKGHARQDQDREENAETAKAVFIVVVYPSLPLQGLYFRFQLPVYRGRS